MKKRVLMLAGLLVMLLLTVTGCGGSKEEGKKEAAAEVVEKKVENIFKVGTTSTGDSRNPLISGWRASTVIYHSNVYERLLTLDDNLNLSPWLAESYEVSEDGLTWTFKLKEGIKWHDGEDFTADDVIYTYQTTADYQTKQAGNLKGIVEYKKVDDYTVQFITENPKADMAMAMIFVVPEHIFSKYDAAEKMLEFQNLEQIGTGPFKFAEEQEEQFVKFVRNDDYHGTKPNIEGLIYVFFANSDTALQAFQAGELDFVDLNPSQVKTGESLEFATLNKADNLRITELGFNAWNDPKSKGNPLMLDSRIRVAIEYAIDKSKIVEYAKGGLADAGTALIPKAAGKWHYEVPADEMHSYNVEKAKSILDEAGYLDKDGNGVREDKDGNPLSFRFTVIEKSYSDDALIIQKNLKDIGVEVKIDFVDGGRQSDIIYSQDFDTDMYIWGWTADYEDPSFMLSVLTTAQVGKRSDCFWSNAEYDAMFEAQSTEVDPEKRLEIVHKMQKLAYDEAPYIILHSGKYLELYNSSKWDGLAQFPSKAGSVFSSIVLDSKLNVKLK